MWIIYWFVFLTGKLFFNERKIKWQLPFFRSIFILFPPLLVVKFGRPGIMGLLAARGLWLRALGVGEALVVLVGGGGAVEETLSCESCPDWSACGGIVASGSGVLERMSGCLTSSLVWSLSPLGSGWRFVLERSSIGLFVLEARSLPSPVKSWPIKLFSYGVLLGTERTSKCTDGVAIAWRNTSCDLGTEKLMELIKMTIKTYSVQSKLNTIGFMKCINSEKSKELRMLSRMQVKDRWEALK